MSGDRFDLLVIGAGSGGNSAAQKAASMGFKVAIAEAKAVGGTCLNRGCTPKKLMVYSADFALKEKLTSSYGWNSCDRQIEFSVLTNNIHQYLSKLEQNFVDKLKESEIELISERATFIDKQTVKVGDRQITADKIIIAVGGHPNKIDIPGSEHAITSDGMFHLQEVPRRFAAIGGGYIGVEFSSMMSAFGSQVTLMDTDELILSGFDRDLRLGVQRGLIARGVNFLPETTAKEIVPLADGLQLNLSTGESLVVDTILLATGRTPNTQNLGLDKAGVEIGEKGEIKVDKYSRTTQENIYAIGDCTNRIPLTPVAKAEGRAVIDTALGNNPKTVEYQYVTSAVFARPEAATVGMSENEARQKYGDRIRCHQTQFQTMLYSFAKSDESTQITMKLVIDEDEKILGIHMVGEHAADIIQSLAVAVRQGISKHDLDETIGIHPTIGEEFLTMY
ncbi:glutathione-disulfide reductase [Myxosarcina sp. GI1]|uniref:glutathione-disulfide reductase n=1 Tax=Myxosarcina sp. GI1 TaxID=1541065 RepID=UPI0005659771|nr:glutathione-disulfide reductase [Myxosarcina sp. GI1]